MSERKRRGRVQTDQRDSLAPPTYRDNVPSTAHLTDSTTLSQLTNIGCFISALSIVEYSIEALLPLFLLKSRQFELSVREIKDNFHFTEEI